MEWRPAGLSVCLHARIARGAILKFERSEQIGLILFLGGRKMLFDIPFDLDPSSVHDVHAPGSSDAIIGLQECMGQCARWSVNG